MLAAYDYLFCVRRNAFEIPLSLPLRIDLGYIKNS